MADPDDTDEEMWVRRRELMRNLAAEADDDPDD